MRRINLENLLADKQRTDKRLMTFLLFSYLTKDEYIHG